MVKDKGFLKKNIGSTTFLLLILILGIVLRFYNLGAKSYWNDEMYSLTEGQQSISQIVSSGKLDQPPAYYIPFHFWLKVFGPSEVSTRAFSALAGIGAIVLVYLIGKELFGKPVGLISAFLMAIPEFQVHYSQQARFYTLFELNSLLSFWFFILVLKGKKKINFVAYVITSILMVYSHTFGVFIIAAQNLFLVLQLRKYKSILVAWVISQVLVVLAFLPSIYLLFFGGSGFGGAISSNTWGLSKPSLMTLLRTIFYFQFSARRDRSWDVMLVNYGMAGIVLVIGLLISWIRQGGKIFIKNVKGLSANFQETPDVTSKLLLVGCWLLCPVLLPFIFSLVVSPIFTDKYLINAAPALYLLLALGIFNIRKLLPIIVSVTILLIMIVPSLGYYYATPLDEQWREIAAYVDENSKPGEIVVFAPVVYAGISEKAFDWYYQGTLPSCGLGGELQDSEAISDAILQCISGHDRFWAIISVNQVEEASLNYQAFFQNPGPNFVQATEVRQFTRVSVYYFELAK